MAATKAQEMEALEQIKAIVEGLGEDSYVGTALKGTLEIAKTNIDDDAMVSLAERLEAKELIIQELQARNEDLEDDNECLKRKVEMLVKRLEKAEGWHMYGEDGTDSAMSQKQYNELRSVGKELTVHQARCEIEDELGFKYDNIEILNEIDLLEINRSETQTRFVGKITRKPVFDSSDWNYIRFDVRTGCGTWSYELVNGDLRQYNY